MLHQAGRLDEAEAIYRRILLQQPRNTAALSGLGTLHLQRNNPEEGVRLLGRSLEINPNQPSAHNNRGSGLDGLNRLEEALASYDRAIALKPDYANAFCNRGNALCGLKRFDEALASYDRAIALKPDYADAFCNRGNALYELSRLDEAVASCSRAIALRPDYVEAFNNRGNALRVLQRLDEAQSSYERAVALKPAYADANYNLGVIFQGKAMQVEAIACYRQAFASEPGYFLAEMNMLHQMQHVCEWEGLEEGSREIRRVVREVQVTAKTRIVPFSFLALPGITAEEQRLCAEKWAHIEYRSLVSRGEKIGFKFNRPPRSKIHIGYLSADFFNHATAQLMAEVFELHDRAHFRITAYSYGPDDGSAMQQRLREAFDGFVDIRHLTHEDAATKIYEDQVDILVDLKGYTKDTRSAILALRPAPIQVNFLGYPGTMGAGFVDYLIADPFIIPPDQQKFYTEEIVRLPDCYQPNDRKRPRLPTPKRESLGLPEEGVVFCCFNQTYKITPDVFDVWCQLLKAVPGSVFWFYATNSLAIDNLKKEANARDVAPNRLIFAGNLPFDQHLGRMQCADLFLDTIPYNAHTTCSEALWMGLPVITCSGETFASRVAGSLLTNIGLPELITDDLSAYYALALDLALNKGKRESIGKKIIANRDASPLFDSEKFTRNLEEAYINMRATVGI